jgi:hypothetical protein
MELRYNLTQSGFVDSIGYNEKYNTAAKGDEPFLLKWEDICKWQLVNNEWQIIKPEDSRYIDLSVNMPDRAGYQRKVFINALPLLDIKVGQILIEIQVKHYLNGIWQYDNNIQDKYLTLLADDTTRIQIDAEGNTWGEFQYLAYLFENTQFYFLQEVASIVQDRVDSGLVDLKLTY